MSLSDLTAEQIIFGPLLAFVILLIFLETVVHARENRHSIRLSAKTIADTLKHHKI